MGKLVLAIVIGLVLYFILSTARRAKRSRERTDSQPAAEATACCAHCGVFFPVIEGLQKGERFYCCEEHRRLGGD